MGSDFLAVRRIVTQSCSGTNGWEFSYVWYFASCNLMLLGVEVGWGWGMGWGDESGSNDQMIWFG